MGEKASTFIFEVKGDAMSASGIADGDRVIVNRHSPLKNSAIVIAVIDGAAVIRRLEQHNGRNMLVADNPDLPPIEVASASAYGEERPSMSIAGEVVGVYKKKSRENNRNDN